MIKPSSIAAMQLTASVALCASLQGCETTSLLPATLGASPASVHAEPPVEIYSRIARSALTCWFGVQGSLKKSHIFHADVAPESAGGGAEIIVHERDNALENPRSFRAYKIVILPTAGGSSVQAQNLRMPAEVGKVMDGDVIRWAKGKPECGLVGIGGWAEKPAAAAVETGTVQKKKAR